MLFRILWTIPCLTRFAFFAKRLGKHEPQPSNVILSAGRSLRERPESKDPRLPFSARYGQAIPAIVRVAILSSLGVGVTFSQQNPRYAVLPQSEAKTLVGTDLSGLSGKISGTWQPLQGDIDALEAKLSQVSQLSHKSNFSWQHVEHPEKYFRQYLGLVEGERKLIYVQAFCPDNGDRPLPGWRNELLQISDGGNCIWHATYDVAAGKFVAMSTNGLG